MGIFDLVKNPKTAIMEMMFPFVEEHLDNGNAANVVNLLKGEFSENLSENESVEFLITTEKENDKDIIMINVVALNSSLSVRVLQQFRVEQVLSIIKSKMNE